MSQSRLIDYGTNVLSSHILDITKAKFASGVLNTTPVLEIVGTSAIKINPYKIITPDGVIISEDQTQTISVSLTPTIKRYTIIVRHVLQKSTGGSSASIELLENLYPFDAFTDATILGWLIYPGSSVVLDSTMLYMPRSLRIQESSNDLTPTFQMSAPLSTKWFELNSDPDISVSNVYTSGKAVTRLINNNTIVVKNSIFLIPVVNGEYTPSIIRVTARADYQAAVTITVIDEYGLQYIPGENVISNTDWGIFSIKLANFNGLNVFTPRSTWMIRLSFQLNPLKTIDVQSIAVYDYNIPAGVSIYIPDISYTFTFVRLSSCLNFYNPSLALPTLPNLGDRYIASATANGWTKYNIYEWNGAAWIQTIPVIGNIVRLTQPLPVEDYVYSGDSGWINEVPTHLIKI